MEQRTRPMSPWIRRALSGSLPISSAGGEPLARDGEYVGVTPVRAGQPLVDENATRWASVPVHPDDTLEECSCGEWHRGWRHRDPETSG